MSENQKKIWITGASSGIGKAVAEKFAAEGWKVAVSARRKELLQELATNENIVSFPLDVTDQTQINTVFKNIISEFGNLDLCLFSSGTYEPKDEQNIGSAPLPWVIPQPKAMLTNKKINSFKSNISPETPHTTDTDNTECKLAQMKNIDIVILSNVG